MGPGDEATPSHHGVDTVHFLYLLVAHSSSVLEKQRLVQFGSPSSRVMQHKWHVREVFEGNTSAKMQAVMGCVRYEVNRAKFIPVVKREYINTNINVTE